MKVFENSKIDPVVFWTLFWLTWDCSSFKNRQHRRQKFENDYWGSSIRELIYKTKLNKNSRIIFSSCGIEEENAKNYLKKAGFSNFSFESLDKSEFIIMTNRTTSIKENIYSSNNITNCFDKFNGIDISQVKRNGMVLSVIRKIN